MKQIKKYTIKSEELVWEKDKEKFPLQTRPKSRTISTKNSNVNQNNVNILHISLGWIYLHSKQTTKNKLITIK